MTDPLSARMRAAAAPGSADTDMTRRMLLDLGADRIDRLEAAASASGVSQHDYLATARVLKTLTQDELVAGGVLDAADQLGWRTFKGEPTALLLKMADEQRAKLWRMVEARMARPAARRAA